MRRKLRPRTLGPAWLRWLFFAAGSVCMGTATAIAVQLVLDGTLPAVFWWAGENRGAFLMTVFLYTLAVFAGGALTGRLWISGLAVGAVGLGLALVDYFKTAINGTPLTLADFGLAAQAGNVAGLAGDLTPPADFWQAAGALGVCVLALLLTAPLTRLEGRVWFLTCGFSLAAAAALCTVSGTGAVAERFNVDFYTRIDAAANHAQNGLTLSLWRDKFIQGKAAPEGYCERYMQEVLARVDEILSEEGDAPPEDAAGTGKEPNVIMILSESFYDLNRLPGIAYGSDPLANFHALEKESISGAFHSHYLGYGTGYIEMSMLYGINSLDIPPGDNICFLDNRLYERFDALPEQYTNSGRYQAEMLHAFDNSLYNRTVTYPLLGFDNLYFSEDVQDFGMDWEGNIYGGYYLQDKYLFQGMLERMEAINAEGKRAFLYGITMENHQPFDPEKFNYECQIPLIAPDIDPARRDVIRVMLEGITRADQSLGYLTDALRESPEPTVVVFFGDHRPNLFMPDGDTVYTLLGLCPGNDTVNWTLKQINDLYSTDYLIWANDAALLGGQAGTRKDSSITAIGPQLLEATGQPVSRYWGLLEKVKEVCLTNTDLYYVDGQGQPSRSAPADEELLRLRDDIIYDALYGKQYITDAMNKPAGTK